MTALIDSRFWKLSYRELAVEAKKAWDPAPSIAEIPNGLRFYTGTAGTWHHAINTLLLEEEKYEALRLHDRVNVVATLERAYHGDMDMTFPEHVSLTVKEPWLCPLCGLRWEDAYGLVVPDGCDTCKWRHISWIRRQAKKPLRIGCKTLGCGKDGFCAACRAAGAG